MLKVRVMPTLLFKDSGLVKGTQFNSWRRVGAAMQAVKVYTMREVDELIFLDIGATKEGRQPDYDLVAELSDECFMPLTVGGGVRCVDEVRCLLTAGADKISINTAALERPELVAECAKRFGSQCIVASIDARREEDGSYQAYGRSGTWATGLDPGDAARQMTAAGAGEILLTSIERDGTMSGYDIELIRRVADVVSVPIVASGGAGSFSDMAQALAEGGASAVAAAAIFHFTEQTPADAKAHLQGAGFPMRI